MRPYDGDEFEAYSRAGIRGHKRRNKMNEAEYYAAEITDEYLHAQADAGDYHLDEQGFQYRLAQDELKALAAEGETVTNIDIGWFEFKKGSTSL